jgi:hypothetical protein
VSQGSPGFRYISRLSSLWTERKTVALTSLAATYLFFFEYLPPLARVHFFSDIEGYHYPILSYALRVLQTGRFPLWDPSIYCGLPLVDNVQAALFYPPTWLLFALNAWRDHLSFKGLEIFMMLHLWLAFFLCFVWFREKRLGTLASLLGAAVYGYSGYMLSQANHVGVVTGMAWTPLALWGIDQAVERRAWRPLWKVAAASAVCFLAGYPPTWIVVCTTVTVYALASRLHWRAAAGALAALGFSLLLVMVQMLPTYEAAALKSFVPRYGSGVKGWESHAAWFIPNYFDLGQNMMGWGNPPGQGLYLGATALVALLWAVRRHNLRAHAQALAIAAVCLIGLINPFSLVWRCLIGRSQLLAQMCHAWNFMEGLLIAAALVTAVSLDDFLRRPARPVPRWGLLVAAVLLLAWSTRQLWVWLPGGPDFAARWWSAVDAAAMALLVWFGLCVVRGESGRRRAAMAAVLLLAAGIEYKVYGASRGFSAREGDVDERYTSSMYPGFAPQVYRQMLARSNYRVALDEGNAPWAVDLRHWGLATPQGFDPLIPQRYHKLIEHYTPFPDHYQFYMQPTDKALMRLLGVRYFVTRPGSPSARVLSADPDFRLMLPADSFFNVYEYLKAPPPYHWEDEMGAREVRLVRWRAARREFLVYSDRGGRFVLAEQSFPGWQAKVDGRAAPIELWNGALQSVLVPPGEHQVSFQYRSRLLPWGAAVSLISLVVLVLLAKLRLKTPHPPLY